MVLKYRPTRNSLARLKALSYKKMVAEGPSGKPIDRHELDHCPEECERAVIAKGLKPGTKIKLNGENIVRRVESIDDRWRLKVLGFSFPVYPKEVEVIA